MIGKKETQVRNYFNEQFGGQAPNGKVLDLFQNFQTHPLGEGISYSLFNGVIKKMRAAGQSAPMAELPSAEAPQPITQADFDLDVVEIGAMEFPDFKCHKTGTMLDQLFSDHDVDGGIYGGTANIIIGESGVGKSTVTLDILAKIKRNNPDTKVLYISSEMTRNDLFFYYRKMPIIADVPTVLLMDYIQTGFVKAIEKAICGEHDVILIDSHQDIIVKLKDVLGWKSTYAEAWLTNLVIKAADKMGKTLFCIQHMTKGGTYVGSTYLKHATTAMMEIKFGPGGRRYLEFTKNRRGGSLVNKPLFYSLVNGEVEYDAETWNMSLRAEEVASTEEARREELEHEFDELFLRATVETTPVAEEPVAEQPATEEIVAAEVN